MTITAEQVADWLRENPAFFEQYAEQLADLSIPHPHGGRAIPLSERQIITLRERVRTLEAKLAELIRFGEENDAIGEKLHRLVVALVRASDLDSTLHAVHHHLREDFLVPHVALRLWVAVPGGVRGALPEFAETSAESRLFAGSLSAPCCGQRAMFDTAGWFGGAGAGLRSYAYIPLRERDPIGLLVLASEDAQRFYPDMGTLYLQRLGDVVAAALLRALDAG